MEEKFRQHSEDLLELLDTMGNNSTNITEAEDQNSVVFPNKLYSQKSNASAALLLLLLLQDEDKLAFVVQVLQEAAALFEEDHSSASWEESTAENFLNLLNKQADELSSCIGSQKKKNTKLHMYFKRLSVQVLKKMVSLRECERLCCQT
ncbi:interferon a3-like [Acanthochromis polyacanthus]|uniref:interferon a3-like n=1 Tax=Acanthochromis polyacanthus TaxID=80966 RepID=UPI0022343FA1|nr:interferon a3-like [Acanthochromis polyacanthus]